jgi:hypothetical protein
MPAPDAVLRPTAGGGSVVGEQLHGAVNAPDPATCARARRPRP